MALSRYVDWKPSVLLVPPLFAGIVPHQTIKQVHKHKYDVLLLNKKGSDVYLKLHLHQYQHFTCKH